MPDVFLEYGKEAYGLFMAMAPYFLFGLTVAGVLHVVLKKEFILKHLQKNRPSSVIKAALFGIPLPLCSCGVVPAALSLRKNRASEGATVAFLISTPQTGVDSIAATYGLLGLTFAAFTPFAALFAGIVGGFVTLAWRSGRAEEVRHAPAFDCAICGNIEPHRHSIVEKVKGMAAYAYKDFLDDIAVRLLAGIAISALIALLVPDDFFTRYLENDFLSMLVMIAVGIPLYICASASIPIALALIDKGLSPGAALVFLTVGPATNAATITLIATEMGKRVVTIYLGVIAIMAVINGTILNFVFQATGAPLPSLGAGHDHHGMHTGDGFYGTLLAVAFASILAASLYRRAAAHLRPWFTNPRALFRAVRPVAQTRMVTLGIDGMTCNKCRNTVTLALRAVPGVSSADVDLASGTARVGGTAAEEDLVRAVETSGYRVMHEDRS